MVRFFPGIFLLLYFGSFGQSKSLLRKIRKDSLTNPAELQAFLINEGFREARCQKKCNELYINNIPCCPGTKYLVKKIVLLSENKRKVYRSKFPFSEKYLNKKFEKILTPFRSEGYLFATLKIDSVRYAPLDKKTEVVVFASLQKNKKLYVRSIEIENEKDLFLTEHLTGLKEGAPLDFPGLLRFEEKLKKTSYLECTKAPVFWLYPDSSVGVRIFVKNLTKNTGDGVVALLPPSGAENRFRFTGNVRLRLRNNLHLGEEFAVRYDKLLNTSQSMLLQAELPFIGSLPLGGRGSFELYKQDSSFLRRQAEGGIIWHLSSTMKIYLRTRQINTSLLNATPYKEVRWPPPPNLDGKASLISLQWILNKLNNNVLPTQGFQISTDFSYGTKKILKNAFLDSLDYDRLILKQNRNELTFSYKYFFPITRRHNLHIRQEFYTLLQEFYLENDLQFVGGLQSVRGFIENEFLASTYLVSALEYRFFLDKETYLGIFIDNGYLEKKVTDSFTAFTLWGTGISFATITSIGKIGLNYAVGKYPNEGFRWTRGRIHIGFYF